MRTRKPVRWLAGMVGVVALLAATSASAQSSCTSKTTSGGNGNFIVNLTQESQDGRTAYTYSIQNAPGKNGNPNKFFVYVKQGLNLEAPAPIRECLEPNNDLCSPPSYLTPGIVLGGFPPDAWKNVRHQDGVAATNVAIQKRIRITANDRFKPEESLTTVLLGIASTYESCGPIFGPTNPLPPGFQGSPVLSIVARITFGNGCVYDVTAGARDNIISEVVPVTAFGTNPPTEACVVENTPGICEDELGIVFCPPVELGRPFLQNLPGGTCYAPRNIKFTC